MITEESRPSLLRPAWTNTLFKWGRAEMRGPGRAAPRSLSPLLLCLRCCFFVQVLPAQPVGPSRK